MRRMRIEEVERTNPRKWERTNPRKREDGGTGEDVEIVENIMKRNGEDVEESWKTWKNRRICKRNGKDVKGWENK
jgi:hypothetical protein